MAHYCSLSCDHVSRSVVGSEGVAQDDGGDTCCGWLATGGVGVCSHNLPSEVSWSASGDGGCLRCSIAVSQGRRPLSNALGTMSATRMGGQAGGRVMLTISEAGRRPWRVMIVGAEDRALTITGVRADEHWGRRMRITTNGNGLPWARSQPMSAPDSTRTQLVSSVSRPFPSRAPPAPTHTR